MDWSARDLGRGPGRAAAAGTSSRGRSSPTARVVGRDSTTSATSGGCSTGRWSRPTSPASRRARRRAPGPGKLRGLGLCYYIESILGDQNETTTIAFADDGMVELCVGTQSNGQGHETAFAQILDERSRHPVREDPLRAGRQRPDRPGRRHRRVALGDDAGQLDQPRRRRGDRALPAAGRGGAGGRRAPTWSSRTAPSGSPAPTAPSGLMRARRGGAARGPGRAARHHPRVRGARAVLSERRAFRRGRGRPGDRPDRGGEVHGGRRLRRTDQPDARRGPGARRRRPGHRPGGDRAGGLLAGGAAPQRVVHGLRAAAGVRRAVHGVPRPSWCRRRPTRSG